MVELDGTNTSRCCRNSSGKLGSLTGSPDTPSAMELGGGSQMRTKSTIAKKSTRGNKAIERSYIAPYTHLNSRLKLKSYSQPPGPQALPGQFWSVPDLCSAYNWPNHLAGGGVIAIVEFGGGWVQSDLDQYFGGIAQPSPAVTDFSVDGTVNFPDPDPRGYDLEVALGLQVAALPTPAGHPAAVDKPFEIRPHEPS